VISKITNKHLVRNLVEKMKISGVNQWTSVEDVVSSPDERMEIDRMAKNQLLDQSHNLVRFIDTRTFKIVESEFRI
jgi:hypothetical protein